ncbi:MAG: nucleotidyltransferase domain-containing protein [Bacteroidota bacterium]|nr:nucleotidyltransferase domain-containing protein [Bacteroidota bacterium]
MLEQKIIQFFKNIDAAVAVYLFGSAGTEHERSDSDIDVAVLFIADTVPDGLQLVQMQQDLTDFLVNEADIVCLNKANVILKMQVLKKGKKLIDRDPRTTNMFFTRTINEYDDLKRIRKPIESQILRGGLHG